MFYLFIYIYRHTRPAFIHKPLGLQQKSRATQFPNEHPWFCWKTTSQGEPARAEASLGRDQGCKLHGAVSCRFALFRCLLIIRGAARNMTLLWPREPPTFMARKCADDDE